MKATIVNCTLKPSPAESNTGALIDIGYTIPGQAWTYWNKGPGPGDSYLESDEGKEWSKTTGETAAQNLVAVAQALAGHPVPAPPSG